MKPYRSSGVYGFICILFAVSVWSCTAGKSSSNSDQSTNDSLSESTTSVPGDNLGSPLNVAPTGSWAEPAGDDDFVRTIDGALALRFSVEDPEDDVDVTIYRTTSNSISCSAGVALTTAKASQLSNGFSFDPSSVDPGGYFFCLSLSDGTNDPVEFFSSHIVVYRDGTCTWTGVESSSWESANNWIGCSGAVPGDGGTEVVMIPEPRANQPILNSDRTISGFDKGVGGGTVIVNTTRKLTVTDNATTFSSTVHFRGDQEDCNDCYVETGDVPYVVENATLGLHSGITLRVDTLNFLYLGDGVTAGHLVTTSADALDDATWPLLTSNISVINGVRVNGVSGARSSVNINGLRFEQLNNNGTQSFYLDGHFAINAMDNVKIGYSGGSIQPGGDIYRFNDCTGSLVGDSSWQNINFTKSVSQNFVPYGSVNYRGNINLTGTDCDQMNAWSVSGSGLGFGEALENDPHNLISWVDGSSRICKWIGGHTGVETDWFTPQNWEACTNNNGNVPSGNDWVIVPSGAANQPSISANTAILGIGQAVPADDGGVISIASGVLLSVFQANRNGLGSVNSDITFSGAVSTCNDCVVHMGGQSYVVHGATMTLTEGIQVSLNTNGSGQLHIGDGLTHGRLVTNAGGSPQADWPEINGYVGNVFGGIEVEGTATNDSVIDLYGLTVPDGVIYQANNYIFEFIDHFTLTRFDNIYMDGHNVDDVDGSYLYVDDCSNATFTDITWSGLTFFDTITGGNNVHLSNCSLAQVGGAAITISGAVGNGAGEAGEADSQNVINAGW